MRHKVKKHFLKKWRRCFQSTPQVIQSNQHLISSSDISQNALSAMKQLHRAGYSAYLVGGCIRDILVEQKPKDFDVVTDASPEQIRKVFPRSRIIGRRFRLVHVYFRGELIEISTFRANHEHSAKTSPLTLIASDQARMLTIDNTYGTIEEDAWRRDFTINALYYNGSNCELIDYTDGMKDLKNKSIRMIGDPRQRFHEDPVRLLRAIRLAAKLNFVMDKAIKNCLAELAHLLYHVPAARILDEMMKLFFKGHASVTYEKLHEHGCFTVLFPQTADAIIQLQPFDYSRLFELALTTTDYRFHHNMSLNPGFLFAIFLWPAFQWQLKQQKGRHSVLASSMRHAAHDILIKQNEIFLLSKRIRQMIRSIWVLQYYLEKPKRHRVIRILEHRYFRAAIDFLQLRTDAGEPYQLITNGWQALRTADRVAREEIIAQFVD